MNTKLSSRNLHLRFGAKEVLKGLSAEFSKEEITAIIGPSGCGKSTYLRAMNRMHDLTPEAKINGDVLLDGESIYRDGVDVTSIRRRIGMVFQKPNPFPKSVFDNVAYGLRVQGGRSRSLIEEQVEQSLRASFLWEEVKDDLKSPALSLSGGQQQRLCIARAIAVEPEVLLLDEPCSALDPLSTNKIEELLLRLREDYCIIIVTHNMQQAQRISDRTVFMYMGEIIEYRETGALFEDPQEELTERYVSGAFG